MLFIKRIKPDNYLKKFIEYCKKQCGNNLLAVTIYGSYAWGYFDKKKSDYDVFVIFKKKTPQSKAEAQKEFQKIFPKITLQYFCSAEELIQEVRNGHWSIYITLLKSAKILYKTKGYRKFLKELEGINFIEQMKDSAAREYKAKFEIKKLKKLRGYKAAKWALPSIRKRLQLLSYIRKNKLIWDLKKVVRLNKYILTKNEKNFLIELDNKVKASSKKFGERDKKTAISILKKLNNEIMSKYSKPN